MYSENTLKELLKEVEIVSIVFDDERLKTNISYNVNMSVRTN